MEEDEEVTRSTGSVNPFRLPSDEEIFVLRDKVANKKNKKKTTQSQTTRLPRIMMRRPQLVQTTNQQNDKQQNPTVATTTNTPRKGENLKDFVSRRREMFLLQMSLDSKKFEIAKLLELAEQRKKKFEEEEKNLMRDSRRFDNFLTENDVSAINAANQSEEEKKRKIEGKKQLMLINQAAKLIELEIKKVDEQLDDCKEYKAFLEKIKRGNKEFTHPEELVDHFREFEENNLQLMKSANEVEKQLEESKKERREIEELNEKRILDLNEKVIRYRRLIRMENEKSADVEAKFKKEREGGDPSDSEDKTFSLDNVRDEIRGIFLELSKNGRLGDWMDKKDHAAIMQLVSQTSLEPLQMLGRLEAELEKMISAIDVYYTQMSEQEKSGVAGVGMWLCKSFKQIDKERRHQERTREAQLRDATAGFAKRSIQQIEMNQHQVVSSPSQLAKFPTRPLMFRSQPIEKSEVETASKKTKDPTKIDGFLDLFGV